MYLSLYATYRHETGSVQCARAAGKLQPNPVNGVCVCVCERHPAIRFRQWRKRFSSHGIMCQTPPRVGIVLLPCRLHPSGGNGPAKTYAMILPHVDSYGMAPQRERRTVERISPESI